MAIVKIILLFIIDSFLTINSFDYFFFACIFALFFGIKIGRFILWQIWQQKK